MILQNLMEERQLDFNQPLLSVRRFSSTPASENDNKRKNDMSSAKLPPLPTYKSELKSGPVANPGTVPFVWERTPGRPKDERKIQTQAIERSSATPKLPPGRVLKVKQQDSDRVSKGISVRQSRTGSTVSISQNVATLDKEMTKHEISKEAIQEKGSSGSDDGDESYVDALETLSRNESFFMNCSMSGLSGWDDDQEVQPSGNFSTDQQTRDFMIGRFLPAAKAMASETPQYISRKALHTQEQPRQIKKVASEEKSHPLNPKWQKVLPHYVQDIGKVESEDESDDDDGSENFAPKVCGLFPRFCLLNPIPGLRMEDKVLSFAGHGMQGKSIAYHRRAAKEHARTAYYGRKSVESQSGFTQERDFLGIPEKSKHGIDPHGRSFGKLLDRESTQCESSCEGPVVEKTLYVDSVHKVKSSSSCFPEIKGPSNHRGDDLETLGRDSGIDKNPSIDSSIEDSKYLCIVDEKAELQPKSSVSLDSCLLFCSDYSSNDMPTEMTNHSNKIYSEKQGLTKPAYQGCNLDHDLVVTSSPKKVDCRKIESESLVSSGKKGSNGLIQNPVSWKNVKLKGDLEIGLKSQLATKDQEYTQGSIHDPGTLASSKVVGERKFDLESKSLMKLDCRETSDVSSLKHPLALPLPKAPSESWLMRTLPTVSSRNIPSWSNHAANSHARTQSPKTAFLDPKWEKIVKSSNGYHGHLRFVEEPLTPISEA